MKRDFPPLFLSLFLAQKKLLFFAHEIICIKKSKGRFTRGGVAAFFVQEDKMIIQ